MHQITYLFISLDLHTNDEFPSLYTTVERASLAYFLIYTFFPNNDCYVMATFALGFTHCHTSHLLSLVLLMSNQFDSFFPQSTC